MLSFEEAGRLLDGYMEELPEEIFRELNGGVNLIPEARKDPEGYLLLGLYHNDAMGRYVEIFYGSLAQSYGADDAEFARQLRETLHHELTHHVEGLAGDRTLEHWDEEQRLRWEQEETEYVPLHARSVLFVDGGEGLAEQAAELFRGEMPETPCGCCALDAAGPALLKRYDAIFCMTLSQADALAERFPRYDEKILCLGEKDLLPSRPGLGQALLRRRLKKEVSLLAEELRDAETEEAEETAETEEAGETVESRKTEKPGEDAI